MTKQHQPEITNPSVKTNFLSGTAGGIAQVLIGHPFDTIKVVPPP